jgi:hypothetical protein
VLGSCIHHSDLKLIGSFLFDQNMALHKNVADSIYRGLSKQNEQVLVENSNTYNAENKVLSLEAFLL